MVSGHQLCIKLVACLARLQQDLPCVDKHMRESGVHNHNNNNKKLRQVGDPFLCVLLVMDELSGQPMRAAQRRRQRRLRSMLRHEQQSIRMALATVMHHSSGKVHTAFGGLRSQTTATRASEEEVHEVNDTLRRQKRPPREMRLAPLSEVAESQGAAATVGYVAALLTAPALGATGVDRPPGAVPLALKVEDERWKAHE